VNYIELREKVGSDLAKAICLATNKAHLIIPDLEPTTFDQWLTVYNCARTGSELKTKALEKMGEFVE
jgi:hypothetical protein